MRRVTLEQWSKSRSGRGEQRWPDETPDWIRRLPRPEMERVDADIARLGRGVGALRLQLGEALDALVTGGGHHERGFSSFGAYARERCQRGARWAAESRTLAGRLSGLPRLRRALVEGRIGWSMAELLARHATTDDDARLGELAERYTVRQMRELLKAEAGASGVSEAGAGEAGAADGGDNAEEVAGASEEPEEPKASLRITLNVEDAWALEATRMLVGYLEGGRVTDERLLEALLAEGQDTFNAQVLGGEQRARSVVLDEAPGVAAERNPLLRAWEQESEKLCEERNLGEVRPPAPLGAAEADEQELPTEPLALDAHIRALCGELSARDLELGELCQKLCRGDGWRRLGYASAKQYARERVGVSLSTFHQKMALARRLRKLPQVKNALREGRIGLEGAWQLTRVATVETESAWLERAARRTLEHLSEEVHTAEVLDGLLPPGVSDTAPPQEKDLEALRNLERSVISGKLLRVALQSERDRFQMSVGRTGQEEDGEEDEQEEQNARDAFQMSVARTERRGVRDDEDGNEVEERIQQHPFQMSVGPIVPIGLRDGAQEQQLNAHDEEEAFPVLPRKRRGQVTVTLRASRDLCRAYRHLEHHFEREVGFGVPFLYWLCTVVWRSWEPSLGKDVAYRDIYVRDAYRCQSPVCGRRDVTPHHLRFRSQGGGDEADNLASLCVWCHLHGIHEGRLAASPPAGHIRWRIGSRDATTLRVHGREVLPPELEMSATTSRRTPTRATLLDHAVQHRHRHQCQHTHDHPAGRG